MIGPSGTVLSIVTTGAAIVMVEAVVLLLVDRDLEHALVAGGSSTVHGQARARGDSAELEVAGGDGHGRGGVEGDADRGDDVELGRASCSRCVYRQNPADASRIPRCGIVASASMAPGSASVIVMSPRVCDGRADLDSRRACRGSGHAGSNSGQG